METKICNKCKLEKSTNEFSKLGTRKGFYYVCKICARKNISKWRTENPTKLKIQYKQACVSRNKKRANNDIEFIKKERGYSKKYWANLPKEVKVKRRRETNLLCKYGLTLEQYDEMVKSQNGQCALCGKIPTTKPFLVVDHNHDTDKVRGLLCTACNTSLGVFGDSVEGLQNAINYLSQDELKNIVLLEGG